MKIEEAVLLLAGKSERFYPLTPELGKAFFEVAGEKIITRILRQLKEAGIKKVHGVVNAEEQGRAFVKEAETLGLHGDYAVQKPGGYGTAWAVLSAEDLVDGPFLVAYGDHILSGNIYKEIAGSFDGVGVVAGKRISMKGKFGAIIEKDGYVGKVVEKPKEDISEIANIGIYAFSPSIFEKLKGVKPSPRGEYEITDALSGLKVKVVEGFWKDVGFPWELLDCIEFLVSEKISEGNPIKGEVADSDVKGPVYIEEGAEVYRSVVEGPAYIGRGAKVGPFSHIRGGIMEAEAEVGIGTTLKMSILGRKSKAKHLNYIGDSVVGSGVNFGGGSMTANLRFDKKEVVVYTKKGKINTGRRKLGALIGDNVKIGANVVILPGRIIAKNSWIYPGVVVKRNIDGYFRPQNP